MKTLTGAQRANYEYTIEVGGITFYMEDAYTLPLYTVDNNGIPSVWSLDTDMNGEDGDKQDEEYTLREMLQDEGFIIDYDDDYIFMKNDLEEIDRIHSYYGSSDMIDSTTHFYKINDDLFAVNPANDNYFYVWVDAQDMIRENTSAIKVWHQGNNGLKKLFFGDEMENIVTVVANEDEPKEDFIILDRVGLEEDNPAYSFEYVGITTKNDLVYYSVNNCNVTCADIPSGYVFTKEEMLDNIKKIQKIENSNPNEVDYSELQKLRGWDKDFRGTPYKENDVEAVLNLIDAVNLIKWGGGDLTPPYNPKKINT